MQVVLCSFCSQVSNDVHATSHHLTRLKVKFANFIAMYNKLIYRQVNFTEGEAQPVFRTAKYGKHLTPPLRLLKNVKE